MDISTTDAIAAIAIALGTVITVLVERFRRESNKDHNVVKELLTDIHSDVSDVRVQVGEVRGRLNDHIEWHMNRHSEAEQPKRRRSPKTTEG